MRVNKIESNNLEENEQLIQKKQKIRSEIEASKRLLKQKVDPLLIADIFFHNFYELLKDGIISKFPESNDKVIKQKVREVMDLNQKIKGRSLK